jgi:sec-independent protein translocase protein TatB
MFDSIGWGELLIVALAGLFIFGPERLPSVATDAAEALKRVRSMINGVRVQVEESLGDDFADLRDLDLRRYRPKTLLRGQLFGDDSSDLPPIASITSAGSADEAAATTIGGVHRPAPR